MHIHIDMRIFFVLWQSSLSIFTPPLSVFVWPGLGGHSVCVAGFGGPGACDRAREQCGQLLRRTRLKRAVVWTRLNLCVWMDMYQGMLVIDKDKFEKGGSLNLLVLICIRAYW